MKKEIEKLDHFGRGITFVDGKICFVENALPGEIVKIKIVKETKKYLLGRVVDYYKLADNREVVKCRYYDVCGGCDLEHLNIKEENKFKCLKVKELLNKFSDVDGKVVFDMVSVNEYGYRNKVTLHGKDNVFGYYEKSSNKIISIEKCLLANEKINKVIDILNQLVIENDIDEVIIRSSNDLDEIIVKINGNFNLDERLLKAVDSLIINGEVVKGYNYIESRIGDKYFYVSIDSFFQVNTLLTEKLYDEVRNVCISVKPKRVLDLYCGTGTIGLYISDYADEVIGVDSSKSNIKDAKRNKKLNNAKNIEFICDKVENVIDTFSNIDLIVVDPPRSGLDIKTIENICKIKAKNLVYISCDPATLARDIKELKNEYEVKFVKPYNMFPRTYHVESVILLQRKN